jgi:protein-S-isoprenylcysteine O-methyltransferase Ste14
VRKYLTGALPLGVFILAVMLGWGLDAWREYFGNPERASVIVLALVAGATILVLDLDFDVLRPGQLKLGHQSLLLIVLTVASVVLLWFLPHSDRRQILTISHPALWRGVGLALCTIGVLVRLLALAKLAKQFSAYVTLQEGHELVQSGIYSAIRHPLYLSLLLLGPGFALVFRSLLVWPVLAVTLAFIGSRIHQEERLLRAAFGSDFEQYRSRTRALIPFVF